MDDKRGQLSLNKNFLSSNIKSFVLVFLAVVMLGVFAYTSHSTLKESIESVHLASSERDNSRYALKSAIVIQKAYASYLEGVSGVETSLEESLDGLETSIGFLEVSVANFDPCVAQLRYEVADVLARLEASDNPYGTENSDLFKKLSENSMRCILRGELSSWEAITENYHHLLQEYDKQLNLFFVLDILAVTLFFVSVFLYLMQKAKTLEINKQKELFQSLLDSLDSMLILTDGHRLRQCNKKLLQYFGFESLQEFLNHKNCICEYFVDKEGYIKYTPDWIMTVEKNKEKNISSKVAIQNERTGKEDVFLLSFSKVGELKLIALVDITTEEEKMSSIMLLGEKMKDMAKKELEARMLSQKALEAITSGVYDGVIAFNTFGKIVVYNESCENIFGFSPAKALGSDLSAILDDAAITALFLKKEDNDTVFGALGELEYCGNGARKVLDVSLSKITLESSELRLAIIRDNTEKKTLEAEKLSQERMLVQQAKMASMGEMISAIAHQWKQPLNVIGILCQGFDFERCDISESAEKQLNEVLEKILAQIDFMSKTIDDFRNFFKPEKEFVKFSLFEAISEIVAIIHPLVKKSNIAVTVIGEKEHLAYGMKNEFKQVILNLINNAKDAILEQKIKTGAIEISVHSTEQKNIIVVRDNAGGIPSHLLPDKIFESYVSTKGEAGTGIGLQIAKTIIHTNMKGSIFVHNDERGAVFTIELPIP